MLKKIACITSLTFSWMHGMDKPVSESDRHAASLIAIAARVHYEAEKYEARQVAVPVAIRVPHNGQVASVFSHMGVMEQRLGQIEEDLKRFAIYEKYSNNCKDILYLISSNTTVGDEQSRNKDFLFMKAYLDKKSK